MPATKRASVFPDLGRAPRALADLFARSFRGLLVRTAGAAGYYPAVESFIQDDHLMIRADLPGLEPAQVETSIRGNVLTIKANRRPKRDGKRNKARYLQREIAYGSFQRQLRLPEAVKKERITAAYTNGVLEIAIPISAEAQHRVPVEGEAETHPVKVRGVRGAKTAA